MKLIEILQNKKAEGYRYVTTNADRDLDILDIMSDADEDTRDYEIDGNSIRLVVDGYMVMGEPAYILSKQAQD